MTGKGYYQGKYQVRNPQKYVGTKAPFAHSSWEIKFMQFCDDHPGIVKWACENVRIPYQNPITLKQTHYVPDFMVQYQDAQGQTHVELIEIKPQGQTTLEDAGRSARNQEQVIINAAKWQAAEAWCKQRGVNFRIITEHQIFANKKKAQPKRQSKARIPKRKKS